MVLPGRRPTRTVPQAVTDPAGVGKGTLESGLWMALFVQLEAICPLHGSVSAL